MAKAYSYVRFSTPEQAKGDSYRRQMASAKKYASDNGLELVTEDEYKFFDLGVSAYKGKNQGPTSSLNRFKQLVESGSIQAGSYLLVESLDRISREEVAQALSGFLSILALDINIVTISDSMVYTRNPDLTQLLISIMQMGRAHSESLHKAQRLSANWEQKRGKARDNRTPIGGVCPYWIKFVNGGYELIEQHARIVRLIFDLTIQGYGHHAISTKLNAEGVPVFGSVNRNKSQLWGKSTINKILNNRAVLGEYQPMKHEGARRIEQGEPITNYYPAVVSEQTFYAASAATRQRFISRSTRQSKNFNVWSKIAKCSFCKTAMHLVNKGEGTKGGVYLRCYGAVKGKCHNRSIRISDADVVFKEILAKLDSLSLVTDTRKELSLRVSELEGRELKAATQLERFVELLEEVPSNALAIKIAKKELELSGIREEIDDVRRQISQEHIFDKNVFFDKLDLETYEGRAEANAYLQSRKVQVFMKRTLQETIFLSDVSGMPFLAFVFQGDGFKMLPLTKKALVSIVNQTDVKETLFPYSPTKMIESIADAEEVANGEGVDLDKLEIYKPSSEPGMKERLLKSLGLE
ncbi:recombinase family protein [Pseudomonas sp. zfem005]|uniref:recombinase family protein n=1 Tax=Pseudomonas sp. zfem005 TaxID=3078200 RepID=UPI002928CAC1|nr:recombinase family protein [Pseudomonas sp. zfem005]MDU9411194.1 recombinase family protein [Pseudomonas sp. zfem005]